MTSFGVDSMMLSMLDNGSHMFHVIIGLDPLGNFSAVENIAYDNDPFEYAELGRNHAPHRLPWAPTGKPGDISLRWGMVVRTKMYDWMNDVKVGKDYRRSIYIIQLSRRRVPIRVYHLTGCFPLAWKGSDLTTEKSAEAATEELRIAYDQIDLLNLGLLSAGIGAIANLIQDRFSDGVGEAQLEGFTGEYGSESGVLYPPGIGAYLSDPKRGKDLAPSEATTYVAEYEEAEKGEQVAAVTHDYEGQASGEDTPQEGAYESDPDSGEDLAPSEADTYEAEFSEGEGGEQEGAFTKDYEGAPSEDVEIHDMKLYETIWGSAGLSEEDLKARQEAWEALKAAWAERMGG